MSDDVEMVNALRKAFSAVWLWRRKSYTTSFCEGDFETDSTFESYILVK